MTKNPMLSGDSFRLGTFSTNCSSGMTPTKIAERWDNSWDNNLTLAKMLDAIDIQPGEVVLDLGCGLGYSSAVIARMADAVVAVEENEALAAEAQRVLASEGVDNAAVVAGPLAEGCAKGGPFDAIMVQGGVQEIPQALIAQLKDGGRIAALFMDGPLGAVKIGHKTGSKMVWRFAFNAAAPVISGFASRHEFAL